MHALLEGDGILRQLAPLISICGVGRRSDDVAAQSMVELCRRRSADNSSAAQNVHDFPNGLAGKRGDSAAGI